MNIGSMDSPNTREDFEHRFHLVREQISTGKFSARVDTGLELVRLLPNGRMDLLSINETARLTANTLANFSGRFKDAISNASARDTGDGAC